MCQANDHQNKKLNFMYLTFGSIIELLDELDDLWIDARGLHEKGFMQERTLESIKKKLHKKGMAILSPLTERAKDMLGVGYIKGSRILDNGVDHFAIKLHDYCSLSEYLPITELTNPKTKRAIYSTLLLAGMRSGDVSFAKLFSDFVFEVSIGSGLENVVILDLDRRDGWIPASEWGKE